MRSEEKEGFQKEDIQVLVDLGLTSLQARAYLALSSLGTAPMRSIAKLSGIARQDIYRLMSNLQELGLAEKIIATPSMYKATPLKEGIAVLLRHKSQEYDQLQAKIKDIVSNFQTPQLKALLPIEDSNFFIISEKKLLYRTLDEKNTTVQKSLLVAGTWESCRGVLFNSELHNFRQALDRGVRIKWITEEHDEDLSTLKPLQVLLENPLFEIRYFKPPIPLQTAIYDEKEVVMCIAVLPDPDVTSIWSNNPMFLRVATNYWEEVWNGSIKDSSKVAANKVNRKLATQP